MPIASIAASFAPAGTTPAQISPSPSCCASARPFAPFAASQIGVRSGSGAVMPFGCISRHGAPSTSTSSPASSARSCRTYVSSVRSESAFLPSMRRPVKPVPRATRRRPGAIASTCAIAAAVARTWRRLGISTLVPRPMRRVARAASATAIQTSPYSAGESASQTRS